MPPADADQPLCRYHAGRCLPSSVRRSRDLLPQPTPSAREIRSKLTQILRWTLEGRISDEEAMRLAGMVASLLRDDVPGRDFRVPPGILPFHLFADEPDAPVALAEAWRRISDRMNGRVTHRRKPGRPRKRTLRRLTAREPASAIQ